MKNSFRPLDPAINPCEYHYKGAVDHDAHSKQTSYHNNTLYEPINMQKIAAITVIKPEIAAIHAKNDLRSQFRPYGGKKDGEMRLPGVEPGIS